MQKISLSDLARVGLREAPKMCEVRKGDLVCILPQRDGRKEVVGIVTQLYYDKMRIMIDNNNHEWWSRFVKVNVLS